MTRDLDLSVASNMHFMHGLLEDRIRWVTQSLFDRHAIGLSDDEIERCMDGRAAQNRLVDIAKGLRDKGALDALIDYITEYKKDFNENRCYSVWERFEHPQKIQHIYADSAREATAKFAKLKEPDSGAQIEVRHCQSETNSKWCLVDLGSHNGELVPFELDPETGDPLRNQPRLNEYSANFCETEDDSDDFPTVTQGTEAEQLALF